MVNGTYCSSTYQDLIRTGSAPGFALDPSGTAIQMYQNGGGFSRLVRDVGTFMFFRADSGDPVGGPYLGPYYVAAYVPDEDTLYWHQHGGAYQDPSGLWLGAKLYALKPPRFVTGYNDLAFPFESYTKYQDLMFFDRVLTQAEVLSFGRKAFGV
jgi:hypothetical protein